MTIYINEVIVVYIGLAISILTIMEKILIIKEKLDQRKKVTQSKRSAKRKGKK